MSECLCTIENSKLDPKANWRCINCGGDIVNTDKIIWSRDEFPIPTYHCAKCEQTTVGFSLCLKCNPETYRVINIDKALDNDFQKVWDSEFIQNKIKDVWNAAIEAAALELAGDRLSQQIIRKLKK